MFTEVRELCAKAQDPLGQRESRVGGRVKCFMMEGHLQIK